jgi:pimeloyl-ACP methyl ester carboxylesterase
MSSTPRVLFFHGLESSINGRKSLYLAKHFPDSYTPNLKPYYLIPLSFWKAIIAIYHFKPDIIVGSSFGGFIAMFLLQTQVWNGNTVLLAPATGLLFKKRLWLPKGDRKNIVIVAGRNDTTVPLDGLAKLQQSSLDNIRFLVVEDDHQLNKSMIEQDQLRNLINANYQSTMTTNTINNYFDCIKLWLSCILCLAVSFIREPFTLYNTIKRLRKIRTEIIETN